MLHAINKTTPYYKLVKSFLMEVVDYLTEYHWRVECLLLCQGPSWSRSGAGCRWDETWFSFACATSPEPGNCSRLTRWTSQSDESSGVLETANDGGGHQTFEVGLTAVSVIHLSWRTKHIASFSSPDVIGCEVLTQLGVLHGPCLFFF